MCLGKRCDVHCDMRKPQSCCSGVFFWVNLADALYMVQDAIEMWLWDAENNRQSIPAASNQEDIKKLCRNSDQFVSMVAADINE